jgi:putative pyruvate formate lyase activating enzyme
VDVTRREFIRSFLLAGGTLLFAAGTRRVNAQDTGRRALRAYEELEAQGRFADRIEEAYSLFERCSCCPRRCGVNRLKGEKGFCRAPLRPVIYSAHPHYGEEVPLVGTGGSGTIFFSNCNLRCVFCQNWPISIEGRGKEISDSELGEVMVRLQEIGCHNINLVTPTHVMPSILRATRVALKKGLRLPLVYNTSGYERPEIIRLLDGIVDIYLPDLKYMDSEEASTYSSGASDYPEMSTRAIKEMNSQVGVLQIDSNGIAVKGLIIRHLVMPNRIAGTKKFVRWVAANLPRDTYINIMSQYHVDYKAYEYPDIARGITADEFLEAVAWAEEAGLTNLDSRTLMIRDRHKR